MRYSVSAQLTYHFDQPSEVLLLLEAARTGEQVVHSEHLTIDPACDIARLDDASTGERRAVFTAQGDVRVVYDAEVELLPRDNGFAGVAGTAIRDLPADALPYLRPSRYCPSDRFESFVAQEFAELSGGDKVAAIMSWIAGHLEYRPGVSDSGTTAMDTFVDRAGVCRDFAHLAISLCRASDIPARAVSAYAWRLEPPDLHLVAEVYLGDRWRLIDPTGLAPTEGMVRIATGHDAADVAFMSIFGRAFLIDQSFTIQQQV